MNPACIKRKRKTYHTSVKFLAKRELLRQDYLVKINRSLIYKWKNEPDEKYFGYELNDFAANQEELLRDFAMNNPAQKVFKSYMNICKVVLQVASKTRQFIKIFRENKALIVECIESAVEFIPLTRVLECFDMSRSRYYNWYIEVKRKCRSSALRLCLKTHPQQLTHKETQHIKQLLLKEEFAQWPIASIAYYALRENIVAASLQTWYKYAKLLGIKRNRPKFDKKKTTGIRAAAPNETWHADVTLYELATGVKVYIYFLMDNFSRRILSWRVSDKLRASIRLDTIREAFATMLNPGTINLLVDGGSENNNETVEEYMKGKPLKKIIAQTDISFSNSMIEAVNKILKHAFLAGKDLYSLTGLEAEIANAIMDYNFKRPHYSLKGLTPDESYLGTRFENIDYQAILIENRVQRLSDNRQNRCNECIIQ